jgi:hypothetical protein
VARQIALLRALETRKRLLLDQLVIVTAAVSSGESHRGRLVSWQLSINESSLACAARRLQIPGKAPLDLGCPLA